MRLIDADALFDVIKERHDMFKDCTYIGDKARRDELGAFMADIVNAPTIGGRISVGDRLPEIETAHPAVRCAECTFFEVRDWWTTPDENGVSLLAASDWPTCTRWGTGDSATNPDGWCYLGRQRPGRPGGDDRGVKWDAAD